MIVTPNALVIVTPYASMIISPYVAEANVLAGARRFSRAMLFAEPHWRDFDQHVVFLLQAFRLHSVLVIKCFPFCLEVR